MGHPGSGKEYVWKHLLGLHEFRAEVIVCSKALGERKVQGDALSTAILENDRRVLAQLMVEDAPTILCILEKIVELADRGMNFVIIDGFPRSVLQLLFFRDMGLAVKGMVFLEKDLDEALEQTAKRREEAIARGEVPRREDDPIVARERQVKQREIISQMLYVAEVDEMIVRIPSELVDGPKVIAAIEGFGFPPEMAKTLIDRVRITP